jgi:hypothetical protein
MPEKIPSWQWTHTGAEVLLLKCVNADGTSYGGFKYPLEIGAEVTAPDWDPANRCGGGLHGWAWGIGIGGGKAPIWDGIWLVLGCAPKDVVHVTIDGGKEKARKATIRCVTKPGDWQKATNFILAGQMAWIAHNADGSAASSGYSSSAASSGDRSSAASSGDRSSAASSGYSSSAASSGYSSSAASSGYSSSAASSGDRSSAASSGDRSSAASSGDSSSAASSGDCSPAVCAGLSSRAKAGEWGCVALAWWNDAAQRAEMRCREVGCGDGTDGKLKAGVWYRLNKRGEFEEE